MVTKSRTKDRRSIDWKIALPILSFAILLRLCVGLHSYSGMHIPPTFGDYEAQRHWMEVTVNLPPSEWYKNGPSNNLSYWGLDYPPLSGYQSWICGKIIQLFDPEAIALVSSKGYETPLSKFLMRMTVVIADVLVYLPACVACALVCYRSDPQKMIVCLATMALNPALIIIDHGHFQYNGISLGLAASAVAAILSDLPLIGSFLFCASLSHKQMSLYFAPAFFAHLLGRCIRQPGGWVRKVTALASVGVAVIASFALMWSPFLTSVSSLARVLKRIFPTQRGLFEDYVANFWCVSSLVIKWKRIIRPELLFKLCTGTTLLAFLPSVVSQAILPAGTAPPQGFALCLVNSAMAFFMFSYQVHEKSILLPLLPLTVLMPAAEGRGAVGPALMHAAMLSMYPLLEKDGLSEAYVGLLLIHLGLVMVLWRSGPPPAPTSSVVRQKRTNKSDFSIPRSPWSKSPMLSLSIVCVLHAIRATLNPPKRYPFLWDAMMVSWACINFIEVFIHTYSVQLKITKEL